MENTKRILKNIGLFLLGIILFIGGYVIHNKLLSGNQNIATTIETDGAEESSGSL